MNFKRSIKVKALKDTTRTLPNLINTMFDHLALISNLGKQRKSPMCNAERAITASGAEKEFVVGYFLMNRNDNPVIFAFVAML